MPRFFIFFSFPLVFFAGFLLFANTASATHEDWHDCIAITGTTRSDNTPNAGSILFDKLTDKGQDGEEDEIFDDSTQQFTQNYPNDSAYRACIDTERQNQDVGADKLSQWTFALRGWAYDDNLGWISSNCEDWAVIPGAGDVCSATANYRTEVDFFGYLRGYAWSTKAGWIQFDWNIDSCENSGTYVYVSGDPLCPRDDYFYQETGQFIPEGRVYDDWQNRLGNGIGHFTGYAWNSAVGWFDFMDAWGVENGEPWYPARLDATARIVNKNKKVPYDTSSRNSQGSVLADNEDKYSVEVQLWLEDYLFTESDVKKIFVDSALFGGITDTTQLQQTDGTGGSSLSIQTDASGDFTYDSGYFNVGFVRSLAPTSNMNGVDMNDDSVLDILNDEPVSNDEFGKYKYTVQKLLLSDIEFQDPLFDVLPFEEEGVYFDGGLSVGLKFQPVATVSQVTSNDEFFINTSRNRATPFEILLKKEKKINLQSASSSVENFSVTLRLNVSTPFYFVFDTDSAEDYSYSNDSNVVNWKANTSYSKAESGITQNKWNLQWTPWLKDNLMGILTQPIDIVGMPVLEPGGSAEARVENPAFVSEISYQIAGTQISFYGPKLSGDVSEDVYNPTIDVTSGIVNVRDIVNVQEGDSLFTVGDIRTNLVRNFLHRNAKEILSSAEPISGDGKVTQGGQSGGVEIPVSANGAVYYFVNGDVEIKNSSGFPDPSSGNYKNVGFSAERTIIVEGGNIFINANIGADSGNAQMGIIALHGSDGKGGNIYIHPNVTNIRAIVYADGVVAGTDGVLTDMATEENGDDWNNDGNFSTQYAVPSEKDFSCEGNEASLEDIFRNQMVFTGVLAAAANTIGGADSDPLRIGTGDVFTNITSGKIIEMVKQHDFNYFRSFKLVLERDETTGYIKDQQCGKWYNPYEDEYYDDAAGTIPASDAAGCEITQTPVEEGGDLKVPYEGICGKSAPATGVGAFDVSYKYSPFIVIYEAISPTLPVFSLSGDSGGIGQSVNR